MAQSGQPPHPMPIGFNVKLDNEFYKITNRDFLRVEQEFSEISPGGQSSFSEISTLEPSKQRLYQVRVGVEHNVRVQAKQPSSTSKWGTDEDVQGFIDNDISPAESPTEEAEFYLPPQETPQINVEVPSSASVPVTPKLVYVGFKYVVEKLDQEPEQFFELPTEAFQG